MAAYLKFTFEADCKIFLRDDDGSPLSQDDLDLLVKTITKTVVQPGYTADEGAVRLISHEIVVEEEQ